MTTHTGLPAITREELANLRWVAREAVVEFGMRLIHEADDPISDVQSVMAAVGSLAALDREIYAAVPGSDEDRDERRWPMSLVHDHVATLIKNATMLEEWCIESLDGGLDNDIAPNLIDARERCTAARRVLLRLEPGLRGATR